MYLTRVNKYKNKLKQLGGVIPQVGYATNIGGRAYQEDRIYTLSGKVGGEEYVILSVFDGHGGAETSEYLSNLPFRCKTVLNNIQVPLTPQIISTIINIEFTKIDYENTPEMRKPFTGSTAVMCFIFDTHIYVANIADSPAILFDRNGAIIQKTNIHDCNNPLEITRINSDFNVPQCENTGVSNRLSLGVLPSGNYDRGLDMTRAFGDNAYKPKSNAVPEIQVWERTPGQILCICSDSFLDMKLNFSAYKQNEQDIVNEVLPVLQANNFNPQISVDAIVTRRATSIPNSDNTSMILAIL